MAEWLRRGTANPLGSARVSSNLIVIDFFYFFVALMKVGCRYAARFCRIFVGSDVKLNSVCEVVDLVRKVISFVRIAFIFSDQ